MPIFSVSELSRALKHIIEETFTLVRIRGEISGFKVATSGHLYMSLKDENALLDAVCWKGITQHLSLCRPENGMEVVAKGRLTTYPGRSRYQLIIEDMELAGEGALLKLLEERKRKLAAEGLFDQECKYKIPFLPEVIGIITSPTGAVIRDILHRLSDRFPRHVLIWPVSVQGHSAADQIATAIKGFNKLQPKDPIPRPDVLIVARGGGSLEDLAAFNEETVVRAAAASTIPLVSAVGHETDTTLIDYAADQRAPTPTAAAEMVVPVRTELFAKVMDNAGRLNGSMARWIETRRMQLQGLTYSLSNPSRILEEMSQRLDDRAERLHNSLLIWLEFRRSRVAELVARLPNPAKQLDHATLGFTTQSRALKVIGKTLLKDQYQNLKYLSRLLETCSYTRIFDRGFALVRDTKNKPVISAKKLALGQKLNIAFKDGNVSAAITNNKSKSIRKGRKKNNTSNQGDLF